MKERNCYDRRTVKFLKVICSEMPDIPEEIMEGWIKNPKAVKQALGNVFCPPQEKGSKFNVWKTIMLGTGIKNVKDFQRILLYKPMKIQKSVYDIFQDPNFKVATEMIELNLVRVSLFDLGFNDSFQYLRFSQICDRAKELGLDLCPLEVGFQFVLQSWNLDYENTVIAMKNNEKFYVQRLDHEEGINIELSSPGDIYHNTTRWIFYHS